MPIKVMLTDRGASPIVVCDACGAWIERAEDGAYAWSEESSEFGTICEMVFVHKGRCLEAFEKEHGVTTRDMSLDVLLPYLAANLCIEWDDAMKMARYFSSP
jgi:hypothetical protein